LEEIKTQENALRQNAEEELKINEVEVVG